MGAVAGQEGHHVDIPPVSAADRTADFWQRHRVGWHVLAAAVAVPIGVAVAVDATVAVRQRLLALGALAVLGIWYAAVGAPALAGRDERRGLAYFAVIAVGFPVLLSTVLLSASLQFAFIPQLFLMLPRWRVRLPVTCLLFGELALNMFTRIGFTRYTLAAVGVTVVIPMIFTILLGAYLTGIVDQSRKRGALIEELTQTRAELARERHEAGVRAERERLSADIHDTLAQGFTSILMLSQAARATLGRDLAAADRQLDLVERTARENLAEARSLVAALAPSDLAGHSLADALARLAARHTRDTGTPVEVVTVGEPPVADAGSDVALLRAAQEALTNVRRYAEATSVRIELRQRDRRLSVVVADDGRGFDPTATTHGYGLAGIRARAASLGGTGTVRSAPGQGTTVEIDVPGPLQSAEPAR